MHSTLTNWGGDLILQELFLHHKKTYIFSSPSINISNLPFNLLNLTLIIYVEIPPNHWSIFEL